MRNSPDCGALTGGNLEEGLFVETCSPSDEHAGNGFARCIIFSGCIVEEAARCGELVFEMAQLLLQIDKSLARFQFWIAFRQSEDARQAIRQSIFRSNPLLRIARFHRGVAGLNHGFKCVALMRHIGFDAAQQIGNEIMPLAQLHIDIAKGLAAALAQCHEGVIAPAKGDQNERNCADQNVKSHGEKSRLKNVSWIA